MVAETTLYDGGAAAARVRQAQIGVQTAGERYRQAVADVEQRVREDFARLLAARHGAAVREEAVDRLQRYLELLAARAEAGQPVAADRLSTRVQLATAAADLLDAQGRAAQDRVDLASALGLPLDAELELAPLPPPAPPQGTAGDPAADATAAVSLPAGAGGSAAGTAAGGADGGAAGGAGGTAGPGPADVMIARREAESAAAALAEAKAERAPQVTRARRRRAVGRRSVRRLPRLPR